MTEERKRELDAQINSAFAVKWSANKDEQDAQSAQAARDVYALTRELNLGRQTFADAPAWKAPAGIPLNAFAKRYWSGEMRAECERLGIAVPAYYPHKVERKRAGSRKRATHQRTNCPNCGSTFFVEKEAA